MDIMAKQPRFESQSGYFAEVLDDIKKDFPNRFINVGAAEQSLLDIGVGLAMSGKIPVCYSITSFMLFRGFETIRNYINYEKIPVILVGRGSDTDYHDAGFSHWSFEDKKLMELFPNITHYRPNSNQEAALAIKSSIEHREPSYISLSKK